MRDVTRLLGQLHTHAHEQQFREILRTYLVDTFAADNVVILAYSVAKPPEILFQWIPDSKNWREFATTYLSNAYRIDPFFCKAMDGFTDRAYTLKEIAPDRFAQSEYYRRYFSETGMVDEMGCFCSIEDDITVELSLGRHRGQKKFSAAEVKQFDNLVPALVPMIKTFSLATSCSLKSIIEQSPVNPVVEYQKTAELFNLTDREQEIAAYILKGHSSLSISLNLNISTATVKVHRRNIYRKMNISSQAELFNTIYSQQRGAPF